MRRGWIVAATVVALAPVVRVVEFHALGDRGMGFRFETIADALATGCLLAYARPWLSRQPAYVRARTWLPYVLPVVAMLGASLHDRPHIAFTAGELATNISFALLVDCVIADTRSALARVLNAAPVALLGRMSYSIYLWQQPFLNRFEDAWFAVTPVNLLLVALFGGASYRFIELPMLAWRKRREARKMVDANVAPVTITASAA